jgi:Protein of unknown function (DUF1559)
MAPARARGLAVSTPPDPPFARGGHLAARVKKRGRRLGDSFGLIKICLSLAPRHARVRLIAHAALLVVFLILASSSPARAQGSRPPARAAGADSASLARYVPGQDLFFYLEFDGLNAHPGAWHGSAAFKLLNDTKLGALIEDLTSQGIELAQKSIPQARRLKGAEVVGMLKNAARHGFVLAASGKSPNDARVVLALRRGDRPEVRRILSMISAIRLGDDPEGSRPAALAPIRAPGRTLNRLDKDFCWWVERGDLILTGTRKIDEILAVVDGKRPSAVNHPLRAELNKVENGFEPAAFGFVDLTALPQLSPRSIKLGLDGLKRIELRWGFQANALMTVIHAVAPSPRRGALALLDQPTFGIGSLPPLPSNLTGFTVLSADLVKTYDQVVALTRQASPEGDDHVVQFETAVRQAIDLDLRGDLFRYLGPRLAFYAQAIAPKAGAPAVPSPFSQLAGVTISVQVRDQVSADKAFDSLMETLNSHLMQRRKASGASNAPVLQFEKRSGSHSRHELDLAAGGIRGLLAEICRPTVVVGENQLAIGATPAAADRTLAAGDTEESWRPSEAFLPVTRRVPTSLIFLNLSDPRESIPALIEDLPVAIQRINGMIAEPKDQSGGAALRVDPEKVPRAAELRPWLFPAFAAVAVGGDGVSLVVREPIPSISSPGMSATAIALVLPALQASREGARRAQCLKNLKQIGAGFQAYYTAKKTFPQAAITDRLGKPLLSWRVAILPYIGHVALYSKFKRNEPWDSQHNKALLKEMPSTYGCLSRSDAEPYSTNYQVFSGKGAMFEKRQDISLFGVTDEKSSTLLVVEAKQGVPWTKPADLTFDPAVPPSLYGAGSSHPGVFDALFLDGSVRFIKLVVDPKMFRALITRHAGEEISNMDAVWGSPQ